MTLHRLVAVVQLHTRRNKALLPTWSSSLAGKKKKHGHSTLLHMLLVTPAWHSVSLEAPTSQARLCQIQPSSWTERGVCKTRGAARPRPLEEFKRLIVVRLSPEKYGVSRSPPNHCANPTLVTASHWYHLVDWYLCTERAAVEADGSIVRDPMPPEVVNQTPYHPPYGTYST